MTAALEHNDAASIVHEPQPAQSPQPRTMPAWLAGFILLLILAGYGWLEFRGFTPAYTEPDPDGYLIFAKRMADGKPLGIVSGGDEDDLFSHQTHIWVENDRGEILPKFAPGYSALMAIAYKFTASDLAMFAVSPICGGLTLLGTYFLCRVWLSRSVSLLATMSLALNSTFLFYNSYLLAHAAEMCFVVWGMFFLWKWLREPSTGWGITFGILAGLTLGFACMVRHTSALLVLPVLFAVLIKLMSRRAERSSQSLAVSQSDAQAQTGVAGARASDRETASDGEDVRTSDADPTRARSSRFKVTLALVVAYSIFPLLLAWYNWRYFGLPWRTGYDLTNEQLDFTFNQFRIGGTFLARGLSYELLFIIFPLGLIGMFFTGLWTDRILRILWILPPFIVYAGYYFALPSNAYYRFLLPVLPMFTACAFALLVRLNLPPGAQRAVMFCILAAIMLNSQEYLRRALIDENGSASNHYAVPLAEASRVISDALTEDAVIIAANPAHETIGALKHFRHYPLSVFSPESGRRFRDDVPKWGIDPWQQKTRKERFRAFYMDTDRGVMRQMRDDLLRKHLAAGRQVVYVGPQGSASFGDVFDATLLKKWDQPGWGAWAIYELKSKSPATAPSQ